MAYAKPLSRFRSAGSIAVPILAVVVIVALAIGSYFLRFALYDWWQLRSYKPPAAIAKLADDTTMLDSMRRIYYANHPQLEARGPFNAACSTGEKTIVLGCYVTGKGIFLFDVTDNRLQGVEQVTAAHEALHAAYERLSNKERAKVDAMTASAYAQVTDKRIRTVIGDYQTSGANVPNELHSILGTEVRKLPADLEEYYTRYFSDRSKIVGYSEQYEQEFTSRQQQVAEYDKQLANLKAQIDKLNQTLPEEAKKLSEEYTRLGNLKKQGQISAYNAGVDPYNRSVNAYNADVVKEQKLITQYNTLVKERNAIALEENDLLKAIDSRPSTIQAQ